MNLDVTIHLDQATARRLDDLIFYARKIVKLQEKTLATMEDIVSDVASESSVLDGLVTFVQGLKDQIAALPGVTPAMQAQIDGIFSTVESNKTKIATAMMTGVSVMAAPVPATQEVAAAIV